MSKQTVDLDCIDDDIRRLRRKVDGLVDRADSAGEPAFLYDILRGHLVHELRRVALGFPEHLPRGVPPFDALAGLARDIALLRKMGEPHPELTDSGRRSRYGWTSDLRMSADSATDSR